MADGGRMVEAASGLEPGGDVSLGVSGHGAMPMLTNMAIPGTEIQPPLPPAVPAPGSAQKSPMLYYSSGGVEPPKVPNGGVLSCPLVVDNARRGPQPTFCEHQLPKSKCKKCKSMARICKHGKKKELCRECDGSALCPHDLRKKECRQCDGSALCSHNKIRRECKDCGGSSYCEHGKRKRRCRDCGGMDFCPHDRRKGQCKECGGSQICVHNRQKFRCKDCYMCVHYRVKSRCPECLASDSADKEIRKLPRGQGWNAKHLRDDGMMEGKAASPEPEGIVGVMGVGGATSPKKVAPDGGIKKETSMKIAKDGAAGTWDVEKVQLLQENQQLRAAAARADSEEHERRRQAAELEKAKAEIERLKNLLGAPKTIQSPIGEQPPPPPQ